MLEAELFFANMLFQHGEVAITVSHALGSVAALLVVVVFTDKQNSTDGGGHNKKKIKQTFGHRYFLMKREDKKNEF